ncbi:MAG: radical SAM protein [Candidatus Bathyarchaeia archaeon]
MDYRLSPANKMKCKLCGGGGRLLSEVLGVCLECIRSRPEEAKPVIEEVHASIRRSYGLPGKPPRTPNGIGCDLCANECRIGEGDRGYCGLRWNREGRLISSSSPSKALLHAYLDPHVTNCCAAWFCPAGTGAGYPRYSYREGPELGYYNYAVFFYGCNFDCLYCQNASHKSLREAQSVDIERFVGGISRNRRISCICFFGGSPEPQLPFALEAGRRLIETVGGDRVLRICFEWNGCGHPSLVDRAAEIALRSGGNIKFDLKCYDPTLSLALSGVSNRRAYENFQRIAERYYDDRPDLPVLTATTLLVPGYVDKREVEGIAEFIASLNPEIPYSLLIFHPDYYMYDLPVTPRRQVEECLEAASKYLRHVHVGNLQLLGLGDL